MLGNIVKIAFSQYYNWTGVEDAACVLEQYLFKAHTVSAAWLQHIGRSTQKHSVIFL